jgi:hypothetical protein
MTIFALSSLARAVTVIVLLRLPAEIALPVPIAVRTVAVRPSAGSLDRPILPSIERDDDGAPGRSPDGSGSRGGRMRT